MTKLNPNLILIGDTHGKYDQYVSLIKNHKYSLQIGDFGFRKEYLRLLGDKNVDPTKHKILGGNHDDYSCIKENNIPHMLGDFGVYKIDGLPFDGKIFFARGAYSIDKAYRRQGVSWWPEEELTIEQGHRALDLYEKEKPQIVITHEAPKSLIDLGIVGLPEIKIETRTGTLLQSMLEIHRPLLWIHGHHHCLVDNIIKNTRFICLPELGFCEIKLNAKNDEGISDIIRINKG